MVWGSEKISWSHRALQIIAKCIFMPNAILSWYLTFATDARDVAGGLCKGKKKMGRGTLCKFLSFLQKYRFYYIKYFFNALETQRLAHWCCWFVALSTMCSSHFARVNRSKNSTQNGLSMDQKRWAWTWEQRVVDINLWLAVEGWKVKSQGCRRGNFFVQHLAKYSGQISPSAKKEKKEI